ncbi:MAG: PAS domain S-box protein [Ignavibacteria bacterium]|jgi:PAS domain S-box-containing protein|nr:PAS domain S-box protein [Ignavibacteria bacterium]
MSKKVTNPHKKLNAPSVSSNVDVLQKKLAWYESFFKNASDALLIIQPETWNVLDANDYSAHLFNMEQAELIGSSIPQFRRIFKLLQKESSHSVLSELSVVSSTGKEIMVEVSARFVKIDDELLIQAIARDVSEQHELTDKLVQADKLVLLGQLSAGVAHDIRNPLAAVNLNLQLLKRSIPDGSADHNYIDVALQGVERIHRIVEVSLNFSKPTVIEEANVNMNSIIPTVLDMTASAIKKKDITVEILLDENLSEVSADAKQLQQVFINLITNAADAIKNTGILKIKTYTEQPQRSGERGFAVVAVSDNGCGIPEEDLTKIFNPFFTRKADGTGLGLPITQRILHQHGGVVDVESVFGEGTTFYVKLPVISKQ